MKKFKQFYNSTFNLDRLLNKLSNLSNARFETNQFTYYDMFNNIDMIDYIIQKESYNSFCDVIKLYDKMITDYKDFLEQDYKGDFTDYFKAIYK